MLDFSDWDNPDLVKALQLFVDLDRVLTKHPVLQPSALFAAFTKPSELRELAVEPWSSKQIEQMLAP
jgi:hypothetical protein